GAQQVRPVENTGTGEGEASGARRPGSDFMVDVFKPLGFEYVSINPHSSSRGTPNFRSVQELAAMVRDFTKWGDVPVSLRQFAQSAVRGHAVAMTPPLMPVVLALGNRLQEEAIPKSMPDRQCDRYPNHRFCQAGSKHGLVCRRCYRESRRSWTRHPAGSCRCGTWEPALLDTVTQPI